MGPRPLEIGARMSPQKRAPSPRVSRTRFRRCRSNRLGVGRGRNFFSERWGPAFMDGDMVDPLDNCCSRSVLSRYTRPV